MSIANENMNNLLFPQKLHKLLDDNLFEEIISWQPHGRSFKVHQKEDFVKKVYPIYFKKSVKYPSFQRQLSYYGFKRQDFPGPDKGGYYHPNFLRGCFSLCTQQVNRHVEREQEEENENALSYECSRGRELKSPQNKGPEPKFYQMTPMPPLPNKEKSKADEKEFNNTRRSHHDHLHPFMMMGGPVPRRSSHSFRSDTRNEYYPRCGHKEWYLETRTSQKDGWNHHEVSNFCSAPSLSFDHDGRQNYHPFLDPCHNPYEHHIMVENGTASSNIEMHDASLPNAYHSHDSHDVHFDNYHYINDNVQRTLPAQIVPPEKRRNIPRQHFSFIHHDRLGIRDEKREDESSSINDACIVSSSAIQQKISPYKNKECSQERGVVQVEPPSLLPASSTFDDERDSIERAIAVPSSSSRSLNEVYSTMMVPGAVTMSDPSYRKSGQAIARSEEEEDADIFGHRPIEEKALLDEAQQSINRDSFEWDDTFISSSYSFS